MKKSLGISLKKAGFSDIEFFWYLRNQSYIFKHFRKKGKISWPEHINWIMPIILGLSQKHLFSIKSGRQSVGQIRIDYKNNEAEISISVLKEFQGRGIATEALILGIRRIKKEKKIKKIIAEVYKNNSASVKLFEGFGFKAKFKKGKLVRYFLDL